MVNVTIHIALALVGVGPSLAVLRARLALIGPSRVVKPGGNGMSGRSDRQQIHDHGLVKSREAMVDVPRPLRRPMPIERIALRRLPVPVPLHGFPKLRGSAERGRA